MIGLSEEGANIFKIDFVLYNFQDDGLPQFGNIFDILIVQKMHSFTYTHMLLKELITTIIVMLLSLPWTRKFFLFLTRMKYWQCYIPF